MLYKNIEFTTEKYPRLAIKREININKKKITKDKEIKIPYQKLTDTHFLLTHWSKYLFRVR